MARMTRSRQPQGFGHKVLGGLQTAAEVAGTAKMVFDAGHTLYKLGQAAAPIVTAALL